MTLIFEIFDLIGSLFSILDRSDLPPFFFFLLIFIPIDPHFNHTILWWNMPIFLLKSTYFLSQYILPKIRLCCSIQVHADLKCNVILFKIRSIRVQFRRKYIFGAILGPFINLLLICVKLQCVVGFQPYDWPTCMATAACHLLLGGQCK